MSTATFKLGLAGVSTPVIGSVEVGVPPTQPVWTSSTISGSQSFPAGTYAPPPGAIQVQNAAVVDMSAATIIGNGTGSIFALTPGASLILVGAGLVVGTSVVSVDGIVDGTVGSVEIHDLVGVNVPGVVFTKRQGGPVSVLLDQVYMSNNGSGVRCTTNSLIVTPGTFLYGGGAPPSGNAAGIHALDDNAGNIQVPGSLMQIAGATIMGYVDPSGQGDGILGETRMANATITDCQLGYNADAGACDSKMGNVVMSGCTIYSTGSRAMSSHYGTFYSNNNHIALQVANAGTGAGGSVGKVYEATGTLIATGDTFGTVESGAKLAVAEVVTHPGSGPLASYPRIGHITMKGIPQVAPNVVSPIAGFPMPTVTVIP